MNYIEQLRKHVGHAPILTAGTGLILKNQENKILLQLRTDTLTWGLPGGSMELGESFEQVAKRELKEETGLQIIELEFLDILSGKETYREYPNGDALYDITAIYLVTQYSGNLKIDEKETKQLEYFDLEKLPALTSMTKNILEKVKNKI